MQARISIEKNQIPIYEFYKNISKTAYRAKQHNEALIKELSPTLGTNATLEKINMCDIRMSLRRQYFL